MKNTVIKNKKASHNYEFIEKYIGGLELGGTEIKSIRLGKASLVDSYCVFHNNELWVQGMHISEYYWGNRNNHVPKRERKILLKRKELNKLQRNCQEKGLTIIATKIFVNDRGWAKIEIALAKGKKTHDKREDLKTKDSKREMDKIKKSF